MTPAERLAVAARLQRAREAAVGLPAGDAEQVDVLVRAGELQVALETLATQLHEHDVEINPALREVLAALGAELDVSVASLLGEPPTSTGAGAVGA